MEPDKILMVASIAPFVASIASLVAPDIELNELLMVEVVVVMAFVMTLVAPYH